MSFHLIVRQPFGEYSRGDRITEPDDVARLASEAAEHVARVAAPEPETEEPSSLPG